MNLHKITIVSLITVLLVIAGCSSGSGSPVQNHQPQKANASADFENMVTYLNSLPIEDLTGEEAADILFMREEEKLARDAYIYFYSLWGQKIFDNISSAEQSHIDALILLIDRYQLVDPITDDVQGYFTNIDLQVLYDALAASGSNSLIDGLMAGAEIEEVDLIDLYIRYDATENQDIHFIYDNLMKGSRNHLRAFVSNIEKQGIVYQPLHLTQDEYDTIINSPMETGN